MLTQTPGAKLAMLREGHKTLRAEHLRQVAMAGHAATTAARLREQGRGGLAVQPAPRPPGPYPFPVVGKNDHKRAAMADAARAAAQRVFDMSPAELVAYAADPAHWTPELQFIIDADAATARARERSQALALRTREARSLLDSLEVYVRQKPH